MKQRWPALMRFLLIVAALTDEELQRFRAHAEDELGLDALVEVHKASEMQRAIDAGAKLIGVNNRDLRTFTTSLRVSEELASARAAGYDARERERHRICGRHRTFDRLRLPTDFSSGESLMRSDDPAARLQSLQPLADADQSLRQ